MENQFASLLSSPIGQICLLANNDFITEITFEAKNTQHLAENALTALAAAQLKSYFEGHLRQFDFPMQQKGTAFQQEVWQKLLAIPYGDTLSYAQFSIENPKAIRAMAAANGKNNLAIVVPCHRVIGSNGKLVGYAGGLWRKQWLLTHERNNAKKGQSTLVF